MLICIFYYYFLCPQLCCLPATTRTKIITKNIGWNSEPSKFCELSYTNSVLFPAPVKQTAASSMSDSLCDIEGWTAGGHRLRWTIYKKAPALNAILPIVIASRTNAQLSKLIPPDPFLNPIKGSSKAWTLQTSKTDAWLLVYLVPKIVFIVLNLNLHKIQLVRISLGTLRWCIIHILRSTLLVLDVFTTSDMENKNSRAWPSSSIIFPFPSCSKHPPHNRLAQRKTHFLPEAAKILIKTQRSVQRLPRCMSSNGNTWGRQRGRSAACNSLTEGEERRRSRGDRGFHRGQREWERGDR